MPGATEGTATRFVAAPADVVYDVIADVTSIGTRSPECYRCEWLDPTTAAATPGARFRGHNKLGPLRWSTVCEVTLADPGERFAFVVLGPGERESTRWSYDLRPVDGGVEVTESYQFIWCPRVSRILELPFPRDRQLRQGMQTTLARLEAAAQARATAPDPTG